MAINNPAARLHHILTICKARRKDMASKPMVQVWRKVFNLADNIEDTVVMSKVGMVYLLPQQISTLIKRYDDLEPRLFLGWQSELTQAFTQISFTNAFDNFASHLSDSLLITLEFCSDALSRKCPEKVVSEAELQKLRETACLLYDEVQKSDLEPVLAQYLLEHIYLVIQSVENYIFTGAAGLQYALDTAVGSVVTKNNIARQSQQSVFGERFWALVGKTAVVLELSKTALELGEGIFKMLPSK